MALEKIALEQRQLETMASRAESERKNAEAKLKQDAQFHAESLALSRTALDVVRSIEIPPGVDGSAPTPVPSVPAHLLHQLNGDKRDALYALLGELKVGVELDETATRETWRAETIGRVTPSTHQMQHVHLAPSSTSTATIGQ